MSKPDNSAWYKYSPVEFNKGTAHMNFEQRGLYHYLLDVQFEKGFVSPETVEAASLSVDEKSLKMVLLKFEFDPETGGYINQKMNETRIEFLATMEKNQAQGTALTEARLAKQRQKQECKKEVHDECKNAVHTNGTVNDTVNDTVTTPSTGPLTRSKDNKNTRTQEQETSTTGSKNSMVQIEDSHATNAQPDFESIWALMPRKKGKSNARRHWDKYQPHQQEAIAGAAAKFSEFVEGLNLDANQLQFVVIGSTFFCSRWEDWLDPDEAFLKQERGMLLGDAPKASFENFEKVGEQRKADDELIQRLLSNERKQAEAAAVSGSASNRVRSDAGPLKIDFKP